MIPEDPKQDPKLDPELGRAAAEIREEAIDSAGVAAAAARVWARISQTDASGLVTHIRNCADFQALMSDYRAGRLPEARALLLQDHLRQCVACHKVFHSGKWDRPGGLSAEDAATLPPDAAGRLGMPRSRSARFPVPWAVAAGIAVIAGSAVWFLAGEFGGAAGRATVRAVSGQLYLVADQGIQPLAPGAELPDGVEVRTAKDTDATLQLRDGSLVEMRERSAVSTSHNREDVAIHLNRGSLIVQAAKRGRLGMRRSGHLYVATADCRAAVTGTVFSVSAGVKGSRVSVLEGEVRVTEGSTEKILRPGDQETTNSSLAPEPVTEDIAWSRDRDRHFALLRQAAEPRGGSLAQAQLPELRYSSALLDRLPASTVFFASIPNLSGYLDQAQAIFRQRMEENPQLRSWWRQNADAGGGPGFEQVLAKLRDASDYLGSEIAVVAVADASGRPRPPVFLAEQKREGFAEFLRSLGISLAVEVRSGAIVFGRNREVVEALTEALDSASAPFRLTPFYSHIAEAYREGVGLLLCADLTRIRNANSSAADGGSAQPGARYFIAEQTEVDHRAEMRAQIVFDGPRTGIAAWLAAPSPMGALDYISPSATLVAAFAVKSPASIVDEVLSLQQRSAAAAERTLSDARGELGFDVRGELASSLGGEFALALDGPAFPTPSWKLVAEVYDEKRFQDTLQGVVEGLNREAAKAGGKPLRSTRETVNGVVYYSIAAADPNPLLEAHYAFSSGYLIAGPTRALVARALEVKTAGVALARSSAFTALAPRDRYLNFSALIYQNLGSTLAPLVGLFGAMGQTDDGQRKAMASLGNMQPGFIAAYGEPDRIIVASSGGPLTAALSNLTRGNLLDMAGNVLPIGPLLGTQGHGAEYR